MKKKILLIIIVLLVFITGCGKNKSNAKYVKNEYSDIKVLFKIPVDDKEYYEDGIGFKYKMEYYILDVDEKNKLIDVYSIPPQFSVLNLNDKHKYYGLFIMPFSIDIKNKLYKKKTYDYNLTLDIKITEPQKFWNKKYSKDMNTEDFYNKRLKKLVDKNLNKAINKVLVKKEEINEINIKELNDEFNKLISKDIKNSGFTINIRNIEFITK